MGTEVAVATAIIGTGMKLQGQREAAESQANQKRAEAQELRRQSEDIKERFRRNRKIFRKRGRDVVSSQLAAFSKAGVAGGSAVLLAMEDTATRTQEVIQQEKKEAESRVRSLMTGATLAEKASSDILRAERLKRIGTIVSGVGSVAGSGSMGA